MAVQGFCAFCNSGLACAALFKAHRNEAWHVIAHTDNFVIPTAISVVVAIAVFTRCRLGRVVLRLGLRCLSNHSFNRSCFFFVRSRFAVARSGALGFVFFDGFKNRNTALKATYTIGDILSRRVTAADAEYIDKLQDLYDSLAYTSGTSAIRVTSLTWNGKKHRVLWSHSTKEKLPVLDNDKVRVSSFRNRIPIMAIADTVILVESFTDYNPAFNVGWNHRVFENFVVTSPRFASCLTWDDGVNLPSC